MAMTTRAFASPSSPKAATLRRVIRGRVSFCGMVTIDARHANPAAAGWVLAALNRLAPLTPKSCRLRLERRYTRFPFVLRSSPGRVGCSARPADPMLALASLRGLVVLDEIRRRPELFPVLRVLADRPGSPARFLVLGSAAPELLRQASQSLAGRIAYQELGGFSLAAVGGERWRELWVRGGFPPAFLDPEPVPWSGAPSSFGRSWSATSRSSVSPCRPPPCVGSGRCSRAATASAELDLLWARGARRLGIEVKLRTAPTLTPSMRIALADLQLERLLVVHAGDESWPMAVRAEAVSIRSLPERLPSFRRRAERGWATTSTSVSAGRTGAHTRPGRLVPGGTMSGDLRRHR
jgi:hypothetical protein